MGYREKQDSVSRRRLVKAINYGWWDRLQRSWAVAKWIKQIALSVIILVIFLIASVLPGTLGDSSQDVAKYLLTLDYDVTTGIQQGWVKILDRLDQEYGLFWFKGEEGEKLWTVLSGNVEEDGPMLDWPVAGSVLQEFGWTDDELYTGMLLGTLPGSEVWPAAGGMVVDVWQLDDGTYALEIYHGDGWSSVYYHLVELNVEKGVRIAVSPIGIVADYLFFELRRNGRAVDPLPKLPVPIGLKLLWLV